MATWTTDSGAIRTDGTPLYWTTDGSPGSQSSASVSAVGIAGQLDIYDNSGGSLSLKWQTFTQVIPDSYNVYANGVLVGTSAGLQATITGLTINSTYSMHICAVSGGVEIAQSQTSVATCQPTASMTVTQMKRVRPFPSIGYN